MNTQNHLHLSLLLLTILLVSAPTTAIAAKAPEDLSRFAKRFTEEELQTMATRGDDWSQLKVKELQARRVADAAQTREDTIGWRHFIKKAVTANLETSLARMRWHEAETRVRTYEFKAIGVDTIYQGGTGLGNHRGTKRTAARELLQAGQDYYWAVSLLGNASPKERPAAENELRVQYNRLQVALADHRRIATGPDWLPPAWATVPDVETTIQALRAASNQPAPRSAPRAAPSSPRESDPGYEGLNVNL